jgi:lipid-A-disaccharide synthase-like uncharacterized protein
MSNFASAILSWFDKVFIDQFSLWILLGLVAQAMFTARFVIQWLASEKAGRSVIPIAFWFFSLAGGSLLFIYAIHRQDPVFILGQGLGVFIYIRNLVLIRRESRV